MEDELQLLERALVESAEALNRIQQLVERYYAGQSFSVLDINPPTAGMQGVSKLYPHGTGKEYYSTSTYGKDYGYQGSKREATQVY